MHTSSFVLCLWVQKHVFLCDVLVHASVSGCTGPWLRVHASRRTSARPVCLYAWAQPDFICELPCVSVRLQPAVCSVLQFYSDPRTN